MSALPDLRTGAHVAEGGILTNCYGINRLNAKNNTTHMEMEMVVEMEMVGDGDGDGDGRHRHL